MPNQETNLTNQNSIVEQIDCLTEQITYLLTSEKKLTEKITTLETELAQKTTELEKAEKEKIKKITELTQAHNAENETLKREVNKELKWHKEGGNLREAINEFIKQKCRNERHIPTTTDKCFTVIATPFKWVAKKTNDTFALIGFATTLPAIFTGLGWMLKAYLTAKTSGTYGAMEVAGHMLKGNNPHQLPQQGGYLPPQPQGNLPSGQTPVIVNINSPPTEKDKK